MYPEKAPCATRWAATFGGYSFQIMPARVARNARQTSWFPGRENSPRAGGRHHRPRRPLSFPHQSWGGAPFAPAVDWHPRRALPRLARMRSRLVAAWELLPCWRFRPALGAKTLPANTNTPDRARIGAFRRSPPSTRELFPPTHSEFRSETARASRRATVVRSRIPGGTRRVTA